MHICRKHFVSNFQGIIFWLPVDIVLHDPYCHISKHSQQLGGLHWPVALSIRLKLITNITSIFMLLFYINLNYSVSQYSQDRDKIQTGTTMG